MIGNQELTSKELEAQKWVDLNDKLCELGICKITIQDLQQKLDVAVEALRRIDNYEDGDPTGGVTPIQLLKDLARLGLNTIGK